jgi:hypothetical protein
MPAILFRLKAEATRPKAEATRADGLTTQSYSALSSEQYLREPGDVLTLS